MALLELYIYISKSILSVIGQGYQFVIGTDVPKRDYHYKGNDNNKSSHDKMILNFSQK